MTDLQFLDYSATCAISFQSLITGSERSCSEATIIEGRDAEHQVLARRSIEAEPAGRENAEEMAA
jgi:hypothetical protein